MNLDKVVYAFGPGFMMMGCIVCIATISIAIDISNILKQLEKMKKRLDERSVRDE